jgi:hypothetical protein
MRRGQGLGIAGVFGGVVLVLAGLGAIGCGGRSGTAEGAASSAVGRVSCRPSENGCATSCDGRRHAFVLTSNLCPTLGGGGNRDESGACICAHDAETSQEELEAELAALHDELAPR